MKRTPFGSIAVFAYHVGRYAARVVGVLLLVVLVAAFFDPTFATPSLLSVGVIVQIVVFSCIMAGGIWSTRRWALVIEGIAAMALVIMTAMGIATALVIFELSNFDPSSATDHIEFTELFRSSYAKFTRDPAVLGLIVGKSVTYLPGFFLFTLLFYGIRAVGQGIVADRRGG